MPRIIQLFLTAILFSSLCSPGPVFSQSPSAKTLQMDTDWEKIRDAQVQMLRNKEAELDRMKEELLTRAQPQARNQTGLPEVEAEFKKREADWLQKSDRYENEITLLKVKIDEQKKERDSLRLQLDEVLKKQPVGEQSKFLDKKVITVDEPHSLDFERRESQLKMQEAKIQSQIAQLELRQKQLKQSEDSLAGLAQEQKDFKAQVSQWEASKQQVDQKNEAERQALASQKLVIEKEIARLAAESEAFQAKLSDLKAASDQAQNLLKRENGISSREQQLSLKLSNIEDREKQIRLSLQKQAEEQQSLVNQKKQNDSALAEKLASAEAQVAQLRDAKKFSDLDRAVIAKQISDLQTQLAASKSVADERGVELKKREYDALQLKGGLDSQLAEMKARFEKEQSAYSEKEIQWKSQLASLSQKLDQSEAKLTQQNNNKTFSDADRNVLLKQIADYQGQIQILKKTADDRESDFKKREQHWVSTQSGNDQKNADLQLSLESAQTELRKSESERKIQVADLSQKLQEANARLSNADAQLQEKNLKIKKQQDAKDQDWAKQLAELENKKTALKVLEDQLNKKSAALEAQSVQLEEKSNALRHEQHDFASYSADNKGIAGTDSTAEAMSKMNQELERFKTENESWRRSKHEVEQKWAEFVNKEMQYQFEIDGLKKKNKVLESQNAATFAVATGKSGERDWSTEARKIVGDRRALGDEKARLYKQLNYERQEFEKAQIQFLRDQREFEKYKQNEAIRIEKLRRESRQS